MGIFEETISYLFEFATSYGFIGIFILSLVSNLIIFVPVPYLLLIFFLASHSRTNLALLTIVSALGAALGKLIIFTLSQSGRKFVDEKSLHNLEFAKMIMEHYGVMAIFIVASTPLPDDIFYIPLGMTRFSSINFFLACFAGKFLLTLIVALGGRYSISWISLLINPGTLLGVVVTLLFIAASIYATIKIDWEAIFVKYFLSKEDKTSRKKNGSK